MFETKLLRVKRIVMQKIKSVSSSPLLLFIFLCIAVTSVHAQNFTGHHWYFGDSNSPGLGIRFNRGNNTASLLTDKTFPFGTGGSATVSDRFTGELLFYTDGSNIFDANHSIMPNGSGLGANTAGNQPVAVVKVPGPDKKYYVFVNTADGTTGGSIFYRIVDMKAFGNAIFPSPPLGQVETGANIPVTGVTSRSEAMTIIMDDNGDDFYLITHANGTNDISVTTFTAAGEGTTANFQVGLITVAANYAYHRGTGKIAVSPHEDQRDVEILDFDNTNGTIGVSAQRVINSAVNLVSTEEAIFDTEWSNSGQYLYYSVRGQAGLPGNVFQFDILNPNNTIASILPATPAIANSYGLQMAPDSAIYHLYQATAGGPFLLGKLTNTDTTANAVIYSPNAFATQNFLGTQFPAIAPLDTVGMTVSFTTQGDCSNSPVSFYPTVSPAADSLVWDFGDTNSANAWSPVHTYEQGGAFDVTVTAFLNGSTATSTQTINITQFDLTLDLIQDTTACACELPVNNGEPLVTGGVCPDDTSDDFQVDVTANGGTPTYQWFGPGGPLPGQTTETLSPDSAGYYYVVATIGSCAAYAGINIKEYDSLDQRANIWYFGQNAGLDFNGLPNDPVVAIEGPLNTPEGTSVISDRNGQVIFSTDGQRIYDKTDTEIPIPVPPGLGGEAGATQSALIMPVAGDETLFYIFTTQEIYGTGTYELRYSLFDLKLNNGLGGLQEFNQLLFRKSTERLTGNANWLISHEYGNNSFRAYPVGPQGIGAPVISSIGSAHAMSSAENGQGYMELGAQNRLAVALSNPGVSNVIEIFDFIDSTGVVTNFRQAPLANTAGQLYGIEVSATGNKIFATVSDPANSEIVEIGLDTLGNPYFMQSVVHPGELGAMQRGPDEQVYVAVNGSNSLLRFQINEDTTALTPLPVPLEAFPLFTGTSSQLGLPNFVQILNNPISAPSMSFTGICLGDSTVFTASGKDPAIDKFDWSFGDGAGITDGGAEVSHLYSAAGVYTATVRIYNKCEPSGYATFTQTVTIVAPPANPSAGVAICQGGVTLDANPTDVPDLTYVWSTGDSTETINVDQQAIYDVTITDANGCTTDASFIAADNRPQFEFGDNLTICQNTPVAPLDAQNPGTQYVWTLNGVNNGNTSQLQSVDTSTPGVFEYEVLVTDPITTCFAEDSVIYTINASPVFTAVPTSPTACATPTGTITINITSPTTSQFQYFVTDPPATSGFDHPANTPIVVSNLLAGTYGVTVQDQISTCVTTQTVAVNDNSFTVAGVQSANCDPIFINVTVTPTPGPAAFPFNYRVIDFSTNLEAQGLTTDPSNSLTFTTTTALPSNNEQYVVEVTDANGCIASTDPPVDVDEDIVVPATFTPLVCSDPISITASQGDTFLWTEPAGQTTILAGTETTGTVQASAATGLNTYSVHIEQAGFCALDTTLTYFVENIQAEITQTDPCADQVTLSAAPSGSYTYVWLRNGFQIPGGNQIVVGTADDNFNYEVTVRSTQSACTATDTHIAEVEGDLQITLASTPPCEGTPFILTAGANLTPVTYSWTLDNAPFPGATNTITNNAGGLYEVTVTKGACEEKLQFNIVLNPSTPGLLTETGIICPEPPLDQIVPLDPGPGFLSYQWFQDGVSIPAPEGTQQIYNADAVGVYRVEMVNVYQCESSDEITLIEECDPFINGPNAFRPTSNVTNSTGELANREFRLFTKFIDDASFQIFIFNRWGELIFSSIDPEFRWNGGYNNNASQLAPPGTYSYVVRYKSSYRPEDGTQEKRGGVVLLR